MSDKPATPTKLIVLMAFEDDGEGGLRPAFEAREFQSEDRATREARLLAANYPAVIAWSREAKPDVGEYGDPVILFEHGNVPTLD